MYPGLRLSGCRHISSGKLEVSESNSQGLITQWWEKGIPVEVTPSILTT